MGLLYQVPVVSEKTTSMPTDCGALTSPGEPHGLLSLAEPSWLGQEDGGTCRNQDLQLPGTLAICLGDSHLTDAAESSTLPMK